MISISSYISPKIILLITADLMAVSIGENQDFT